MWDTLDHIRGMSNGVSGLDRKSCPPSSYWLRTPASSSRTRLVGRSDKRLASTEPAGPPPMMMKSYSRGLGALAESYVGASESGPR